MKSQNLEPRGRFAGVPCDHIGDIEDGAEAVGYQPPTTITDDVETSSVHSVPSALGDSSATPLVPMREATGRSAKKVQRPAPLRQLSNRNPLSNPLPSPAVSQASSRAP